MDGWMDGTSSWHRMCFPRAPANIFEEYVGWGEKREPVTSLSGKNCCSFNIYIYFLLYWGGGSIVALWSILKELYDK